MESRLRFPIIFCLNFREFRQGKPASLLLIPCPKSQKLKQKILGNPLSVKLHVRSVLSRMKLAIHYCSYLFLWQTNVSSVNRNLDETAKLL